jgi:hypothetical protein
MDPKIYLAVGNDNVRSAGRSQKREDCARLPGYNPNIPTSWAAISERSPKVHDRSWLPQ